MPVRALRARIVPNKKQRKRIDTTIDCCRFVYNHMLSRNNKVYQRRGEHLNYNAMQNLLPQMKKYLPWLTGADSQALKYACRQLDTAFTRFFKKLGGRPNFHSKRNAKQSYTTTNAHSIQHEPGRVKLPCLGWVQTLDGRTIPKDASICKATIIRDHGQYFVSIAYKYKDTTNAAEIHDENVIGLDYKSDGLYADSEGKCCDMPHYYRMSQQAIAKEQRRLAAKRGARKGEKPSGNFKRQQVRLFKKTRHAANQRKDFLHKRSTAIAKRYDAVCVEDLDMKGMANKGFGNGKATLDNGYGMFLQMLEYKLADRGKLLMRIDKWYPSSQICSRCGHRQKMPLDIRTYECPECGAKIDRDHNAAINIKAEGLQLIRESEAV